MNSTSSSLHATPVTAPERIASIDVLRGFAVLGILIVNMQGFARVSSAYMNPTSGSAFVGEEAWIWTVVYILADTKFLSIFSMLFGAGIAMMSERHGDVLVAYALCGFLLYPLRKLNARTLLWMGGCVVAFVVPFWLLAGLSIPYWPDADRLELVAQWAPPQEVLDSEITAFRGGLGEQLAVRAPIALELQTSAFLGLFLWRAGGLMLVGMGLYKLGVLAAARSVVFYRRMAVIGIGTGLPLAVAGAWYKVDQGFAFETVMFQGALFNYVGSVGVFLGYIGLVMLMVQFSRLPKLTARLAATGRMALTNYVTQSLICTLVFYGHGLGLFERVAAPGRTGIVFAIWALQLLWSPWWLKRFRFGPLEWIWRSATYMKPQPMRV
ncbi:MAG: DUF418 domain-containing protein [Bacteroidota bacterium]|nr:DUF418 domain-containing protein [Bacteroidota bacterium]